MALPATLAQLDWDCRTHAEESNLIPPSDPTTDPGITLAFEPRVIETPGIDPAPEASPSSPHASPARRLVLDSSSPGIANETRSLLQRRLRITCVVLLAVFGLFVARGFLVPFPTGIRTLHVGLMAGLAIGIFALGSRTLPLSALRWIETAIFGSVQSYLLATEIVRMRIAVDAGSDVLAMLAVKGTILFTLVLMAIYGMFIPNRWQRSAPMIIFLAVSPIGAVLAMRLVWEDFARLATELATIEQITENVLVLFTAAVCTIVGTHVIDRLRGEVFEAKRLGQYRLQQKIGAGGMGEVYRAEHQLLARPCAIKVIRPDRALEAEAIKRFESEVQAAARLTHWNTVEVYDYGRTDDGVFFYVMELIEGASFEDLVRRHGPLPPERVIFLALQVCDALAEAAECGMVHRDIKPSNLFAAIRGGRYDVAKLTDFGLAMTVDSTEITGRGLETRITGSPLFLSPEQANGVRPDTRSDLYSLGAVLYFLLAGQPPFPATTAVQAILAHAQEPAPPLQQVAPKVPGDLAAVVMRTLEKRAEDRFPNPRALQAALSACQCARGWSYAKAEAWWRTFAKEESISTNNLRR